MHLRKIGVGGVGSTPVRISFTLHTGDELEQLDVRGMVDAANASELRAVLLETIENCPCHLVVDITGVDFADASGLGVLVGALRHARIERKRFDLVCTDERLLKVFALTSLDRSFGLFESADAAMQASADLLTTSVIALARKTEVAS